MQANDRPHPKPELRQKSSASTHLRRAKLTPDDPELDVYLTTKIDFRTYIHSCGTTIVKFFERDDVQRQLQEVLGLEPIGDRVDSCQLESTHWIDLLFWVQCNPELFVDAA